MARVTADSVIDDQIDAMYEALIRLDQLHLRGEDRNLCGECGKTFPCDTREVIQQMKAAFTARRGPHPMDVETRIAQKWCYQDPTTRQWVHTEQLHRGCILR